MTARDSTLRRRLRRARALTALAVAAAGLGAGCAREASTTGIVLEVDSDLQIPGEMNRLAIRVTSAGKSVFDRSQDLGVGGGRITLPTRLGLVPAGDGTGSFAVEVAGQLGDRDVITRKAVLPFVRGSILLLRIDLLKECAAVMCGASLTCVPGRGCVDPAVDPGTLPRYGAGDAGMADGGATDVGAGDGPRQDGPPGGDGTPGVEAGAEAAAESPLPEPGAEIPDGPAEPAPDGGPDGPVLTCNPGTTPTEFPGVTGIVYTAAFSPSGALLASGGDSDTVVKIWDVGAASALRDIVPSPYTVLGVAFSPDGTTLAAVSMQGKASLWNVSDGSLKHELVGHTNHVTSTAFSPDGTTVATGSYDGTVILWNAAAGSLVRTLTLGSRAVKALAFLGNDRLVTADDAAGVGTEGLKLWDLGAATVIRAFTGPLQFYGSAAVAVNADGTLIADGESNGVTFLWNPDDNSAPVRTITDANTLSEVTSVAFSPDGKRLVVGLFGGTASVWEVGTGAFIKTLQPKGIVHAVAFSPTGKLVATAGSDYVKLWGCE